LVVLDVFALAVFFAAGFAELPQGFLAAQPPFGAMAFTSFHKCLCPSLMEFSSQKQTRDVLEQAKIIAG